MRSIATHLALTVTLLLAGNAVAQSPGVQYARVLVPIVLRAPVSGALGSVWTTEFLLSNTSSDYVSVFPYSVTGQTCDTCMVPSIAPTSTGTGGIVTDANGLRGTFLYVERSHLSDIQMVLRVRDLSRASQTWGTSVPIVSEDRFRSRPFSIIDIPNDIDFRSTLRIYGLDSIDATPVLLRLYGRNDAPAASPVAFTTDTLLGEATLTLAVESLPPNFQYPTRPAFLELSDLSAVGNPKGHRQLRLEVTSLREGKRLWAFVSVTNNSTQHVTVLEPLIP